MYAYTVFIFLIFLHIQSLIFTRILQGSPNVTWTRREGIGEFSNFLKGSIQHWS